MTIELDGKVIYTSDSAIAYSQDIPVEFSGTEVGKKFEIIGVTGQLLGFKDSFKIAPMPENVFPCTRFIILHFWVDQKSRIDKKITCSICYFEAVKDLWIMIKPVLFC